MTLEEAIIHCREKSMGDCPCADDHRQLAEWLEQLQVYQKKDVIEVVRCGECKHMTANGRCREFADNFIRPSASDYCSYGERKDG